jgi:hypothetical protein
LEEIKMKLWKFNKITGYWNVAREVTKETKDQWLAVFQKTEPIEFFKVSKNRPSKMPY